MMIAMLVHQPPSLEAAMETARRVLNSPNLTQISAAWQLNLFGEPDDAIVYYGPEQVKRRRRDDEEDESET